MKINETTQLELFSFPHTPQRPNHPEASGLRHLAFAVADIIDTVKYLKKNGVTVEDIRVDSQTGKKYTFFFDPDNLPLEVYQE